MSDKVFKTESPNIFLKQLEQILYLKQERTEQGRSQYLHQKALLAEKIRSFFDDMLKQTGGEITPAILQIADELYVEDVASMLHEALGVNKGELRRLLARTRKIECRRCHKLFTVTELRRIGGYSEKSNVCSDCQALWREEFQALDEHVLGEVQRAVDLNALVLTVDDPLTIHAFTARLMEYADFWSRGKVSQICYQDDVQIGQAERLGGVIGRFLVGGGCMLCGTTPPRMWWTRKSVLNSDHPLARLLHQRGISPIQRSAQLIANLTTQEYFSGTPHFPLIDVELLLLCDSCSHVAEDSHREISGQI